MDITEKLKPEKACTTKKMFKNLEQQNKIKT